MKDHYDPWYVRLPDGRTIKAKSTASVRHHVEAGHIPLNSLLRRTSDEEWVELTWLPEFVDLGSTSPSRIDAQRELARESKASGRSGVSARLDPMRLQTVGVRGFIDELIAALDSTLTRTKILPAMLAGIVLYLGIVLAPYVLREVLPEYAELAPVVSGAVVVVVLSLLNAFLARLTHLELSTMRPARLGDGLRGFLGYGLNVLMAQFFVAGGGLALLYLLRIGPEFLPDANGPSLLVTLNPWLRMLMIILSVILWLMIGACWLLTPAIVVEESSWLAGLREWRQLVRDHFGRILVYEGLALFMGLVVALPLTIAVNMTLHGQPALFPRWPTFSLDGRSQVWLLVEALNGLTVGPMLATLAVTNVFIYLNLRYESPPNRSKETPA